jgi:hypothetical protein
VGHADREQARRFFGTDRWHWTAADATYVDRLALGLVAIVRPIM